MYPNFEINSALLSLFGLSLYLLRVSGFGSGFFGWVFTKGRRRRSEVVGARGGGGGGTPTIRESSGGSGSAPSIHPSAEVEPELTELSMKRKPSTHGSNGIASCKTNTFVPEGELPISGSVSQLWSSGKGGRQPVGNNNDYNRNTAGCRSMMAPRKSHSLLRRCISKRQKVDARKGTKYYKISWGPTLGD